VSRNPGTDRIDPSTRALTRDAIAIVGLGATEHEKLRTPDPYRSSIDLGVQALGSALADAGLKTQDIDGLMTVALPYDAFAQRTGLEMIPYVMQYEGGGRWLGGALNHAAQAIVTGAATTIAIIVAFNNRSVDMQWDMTGSASGSEAYEALFGLAGLGSHHAMMFRRHQAEFGTPREVLGHVAVSNRANAARNPHAIFRAPMTLEDYAASRMIADPLRLFDYCTNCDGAIAIIVTDASATKPEQRPVIVHDAAMSANVGPYYSMPDCYYASSRQVAAQIFSGDIKQSDIDTVGIYDNFTTSVVFALEGYDFQPRGGAAEFIMSGNTAFDGSLPVNTSGGHTSEVYLQGINHIAEIVTQLRGEAGERQLANVETAAYMNSSNVSGGAVFHR
jgi:acetyl-CoA acetyltransferase